MQITMVGTGYVGLVTGTCFADTGNDVTCLDIDDAKIAQLNQGKSPIYEPGLSEMIARNIQRKRLHFTTDKQQAYRDAEIIFICVGTPQSDTGEADLKYVLAAARDIGQAIDADTQSDEPKIIVVKSTVPVGTNIQVENAIREVTSKPFHMASNPEFLKEGAAIRDFMYPDRVVLGVKAKRAGETLRELYEPFVRQGNPIFIMDIPSAEMVKYAANAMLATKISFINEIAGLCEVYEADVDDVWRGMTSDSRIGNKFLYPGLGYGGSCFPKDVQACIAMASRRPDGAPLLTAVHEVNRRQRERFIERIFEANKGDVSGKKVAIWGIAFKPGTDDIREAPSLTIMEALSNAGASVVAYDQVAIANCKQTLGDKVAYCEDPMEALDDADFLVICTDWGEFRHPDFDEMKSRMKSPVIFDGRNLFHLDLMEEHGFTYYSVGRSTVGR